MFVSFDNNNTPGWVTYWLGFMVALVVAMVVIGGATRLTNSGLSITEWAPISGALPPMSQEAWIAEFEKYKQIPEFEAEHPGMDLAGFRIIYFWEWAHRQLGRIVGLVFAVPFFILLLSKRLPKGRALALTSVLFLIGLQGGIGWW
ncbi:MAG: COX15/CtaA family protein, partial [Pseudomonadota bacterium]